MSRAAWRLYQHGVQALSQSRWSEACDAFLGAWTLERHGAIAGSLGACEYKLGRYRDAAEHLAIYTRELRKDEAATAAQREAAQAAYYEVRTKVGTVPVVVSPEGATVAVDGREVGTAPLSDPVFVEPGEHVIEARREGYTAKKATVVAKAGGIDPVALWLDPVPAAPPVRREEKEPARTGAERGEGSSGGAKKTIVIAGAVTAGATAAAGAVFTVLATGKTGQADDKAAELLSAGGSQACAAPQRAAECAALRGLRGDAATFANVATWSFIGAGAVGLGTGLYWLVAPQPIPTAGFRASPIIAAGGGGVALTGTW